MAYLPWFLTLMVALAGFGYTARAFLRSNENFGLALDLAKTNENLAHKAWVTAGLCIRMARRLKSQSGGLLINKVEVNRKFASTYHRASGPRARFQAGYPHKPNLRIKRAFRPVPFYGQIV